MPVNQYVSIDAPCTHWCVLHSISYALCHEYAAMMRETALNALFTPEKKDDISTQQALKNNWESLGVGKNEQENLLELYAEPVVIAHEIRVFLAQSAKEASAEVIKDKLSPLLYHLYQKMAIIPDSPQGTAQHRYFLSGLLGSYEQANQFILSISDGPTDLEQNVSYQQELQQRFNYLHHKINEQTNPYRSYSYSQDSQTRNITVALEPPSTNPLEEQKYRLCEKMASQITQLFFRKKFLPEIQIKTFGILHEFEIFGSKSRYVLKNSADHLKLLINTSQCPEALHLFSQEKGFKTQYEFSWRTFFSHLYDQAIWFCYNIVPWLIGQGYSSLFYGLKDVLHNRQISVISQRMLHKHLLLQQPKQQHYQTFEGCYFLKEKLLKMGRINLSKKDKLT